MVTITAVENGSYCGICGIKAGDELISVNDNNINDVLDYRFHIMNEKLKLVVKRADEVLCFSFRKKDEYDDIGLEFETYLMDKKHSCRNKCVFCFIDQNPLGMRESVYFKDDDDRLSFFFGNYVTLTNLSQQEVDRVIKMRISPVNVSVHTTNPELRCKMMNNRFAGESLKYLDDFQNGGISVNCQIVLCKGLNDGEELENSLRDLSARFPCVESIAVVPAGLTAHRQGLYPLETFSNKEAAQVIEIISKQGRENLKNHGTRLVYASDEWYLRARLEIPSAEYYEDFPQLDNGVGLIRSMFDEIKDELEFLEDEGDVCLPAPRNVSVVTGEAAFGFISDAVKLIEDTVENFKCNVYCAKNEFFGGGVTVAGLLTGSDLIKALSGKELGEKLFIPSVMLRHEGDLFLDNISLAELSETLGVEIYPIENSGYEFVNALLKD